MSAAGEPGRRAHPGERAIDAGTGTLTVDVLGRRCPAPVIELARRIRDVAPGGVLAVWADDEAAAVDIPAWCRMRGQDYLGSRPLDGGRRGSAYLVRRARA